MKIGWTHLEPYRVRSGDYASQTGDPYGQFMVPHPEKGHLRLAIIATDGQGVKPLWEHVSVHVRDSNGTMRIPGWLEMAYVKSLFWEPTEVVVQYHVPVQEHVNVHPCVLHLWRPVESILPRPPVEFV